MTKGDAVPKRRISFFKAAASASILFAICLTFLLMLQNSGKQRQALEAADRYTALESKIERLIYSNVTLLQGFEAYIRSNPNLDESGAYRYLGDLTSKNSEYIRNIGIIRDTTILWNYPRESNAAAIGVDLSKVEGQREGVLRVKAELVPIFQGPVNLVQGGTGFVVRIPIVRDGTGYWGQTSIVLESEKILEEIGAYARSVGLDIAIFNQANGSVPFFGAVRPGANSLFFDVDPSFIKWEVCVNLPNGRLDNPWLFLLFIVLSGGLSASVGAFAYNYLKTNDKLREMSTHDFLTGLYNRHFLDEYQAIVLSAAKRESRKAAILMIDLNHFKEINDTHGHGVGDMVLVETSRILQKITRTNEAAFRLGGDEFLLILPEIESAESLEVIAERLATRFEQEFELPGYPAKVTPGIGWALFPEDGDDIDSLLRAADKRLYAGKAERQRDEKPS